MNSFQAPEYERQKKVIESENWEKSMRISNLMIYLGIYYSVFQIGSSKL